MPHRRMGMRRLLFNTDVWGCAGYFLSESTWPRATGSLYKIGFLCKLFIMTIRNVCQQLKLVGLLALVILTVLTPPAVAQDPPPAESAPSFDPRFGIVDSFVNTEAANATGAGWTRVFFRWDVVQPAGPFDWKPANVPDTLLNAEIAAGREVVAVLIGTPAWATDSRFSTAVPPLEFWGDFVFKIASQYKGRIKHWVIWNQPDITDPASSNHTWDGTEADYYLLLKEAYLKIKAVDPEMQVHLAGLTYTWDRNRGTSQYLSRLLEIIVADPQAAEENYFFDAVSYHLYYDPGQILEILTDVRGILDRYGLGHKPVWINETNAPPSEDYIEPLEAPAAFNITLEEQSAFVIQAFALALAGGAERIAFNKMRNERNHPESVEPYGLLRGDDSRRPAFNAFQVVTRHFRGEQNTTWLQLGNVYIVTMDRGGQTTTVLWNVAPTPATFNLNAIAPQALLVDEQGNEQTVAASNGVYTIQLPGAVCSNGSNCFIGGAPRLIIEQGSPEQRPALLPVLTPTPSPSPVLTATPVPTDTPLPSPPTLTPTPAPPPASLARADREEAGDAPVADILPSPEDDPPPVLAALPDPELELPEADQAIDEPITPNPTTVPPVTLSTVLKPRRILWLFVIGLIVFTVSYGVQVAIWYRLKR